MACGVEQKCSGRYTGLIRMYLIIAAAAAAGLSAVGAVRYGITAMLLPAALSAVLLWAVIVLPDMYAERLTYTRHRDWLMVQRGILWRQTILIPRRQIQYVRLKRGPVERLFRLATLVFMTPGGRVCMHGLEPDDAERLRRLMERS